MEQTNNQPNNPQNMNEENLAYSLALSVRRIADTLDLMLQLQMANAQMLRDVTGHSTPQTQGNRDGITNNPNP